jgi:hypothetical protein
VYLNLAFADWRFGAHFENWMFGKEWMCVRFRTIDVAFRKLRIVSAGHTAMAIGGATAVRVRTNALGALQRGACRAAASGYQRRGRQVDQAH